jgi:hypothetical protein
MPDVKYDKESDADAYVIQLGKEGVEGVKIPVDEDGDGVQDGWRVVKRISEGTRGMNPSEAPDPEGQAAYLEAVQKAGQAPKAGELGYMQGGMNFTNRGPVKYAKGGAVRGKRFSGSY